MRCSGRSPGTHIAAFSSLGVALPHLRSSALRCTHLDRDHKQQLRARATSVASMSEETAPYGSGAQDQARKPVGTGPAKRVRTQHLREMKQRGERFAMLTAYDMY